MKKRIAIIFLCIILALSTMLSGCKSLGKMIGQKIRESREEEETDDWDDYDDDDYDWDDYDDDDYDWDDYDDDYDEYDEDDWDDEYEDDWDNDTYDDDDWDDDYEDDDWSDEIETIEDFFDLPENEALLEESRNAVLSLYYATYADVVYDFSGNDIYIDYYYLEKYEEMEDDIAENLEATDWTSAEEADKRTFFNLTGIEPENIYYSFYIEGGDYLYSNY